MAKVVNKVNKVNPKTVTQRIGGVNGYANQQFIKHCKAVIFYNFKVNGLNGSYTNRNGKVVQSNKAKPVSIAVHPSVYNYMAKHLINNVVQANINNNNVVHKGLTYKQQGATANACINSLSKWLANNVPVSNNGKQLAKGTKFYNVLPKHRKHK